MEHINRTEVVARYLTLAEQSKNMAGFFRERAADVEKIPPRVLDAVLPGHLQALTDFERVAGLSIGQRHGIVAG